MARKGTWAASVTLLIAGVAAVQLVGCGGGGGAGGLRAAGTVVLPAGSSTRLADLRVRSCLGSAAVNSRGEYSVEEPDTGPAMVVVTDPQGRIALMGFVDAGDPGFNSELSAKSTAVALLFHQLNTYTLPPSAWKEALQLIAASPHADTLAGVVAARIAADPGALQSEDAQLRAALIAAADAIVPADKRVPPGTGTRAVRDDRQPPTFRKTRDIASVLVSEPSTQSGTLVGGNPDGDGFVLTNHLRRHVYYWVYMTAWEDENGVKHPVGSWNLVSEGYISATNGLAGALGSAIDALWGNVAYKPVQSVPIDVEFAPEEAVKVYYSVVTVGAGSKSADLPPELQGSPLAGTWATGLGGMQAITAVKDFILPALFTFVPADAVGRLTGRQLTDFSFGLIGLCAQSGFDASTAIASNDWWGALKTVAKGIVTDAGLREKLAEYVATKLLARPASAAMVAEMSTLADLMHKALKITDLVYLGIDYVALTRDCADSDLYNHWEVVATKPKTKFGSGIEGVHPAQTVELIAIKGFDSAGEFRYRYRTEGKYGTLTAGTSSGTDINTLLSSVKYACNPDAPVGETETVSVQIERILVKDDGTHYDTVGTAEKVLNITPWEVTLDPEAAQVQARDATPFTAKMDGVVSTDDRMWYHWTNTGQYGHLDRNLLADDIISTKSTMDYVAGAQEGRDDVGVEAYINYNGKKCVLGTAQAPVLVREGNLSYHFRIYNQDSRDEGPWSGQGLTLTGVVLNLYVNDVLKPTYPPAMTGEIYHFWNVGARPGDELKIEIVPYQHLEGHRVGPLWLHYTLGGAGEHEWKVVKILESDPKVEFGTATFSKTLLIQKID